MSETKITKLEEKLLEFEILKKLFFVEHFDKKLNNNKHPFVSIVIKEGSITSVNFNLKRRTPTAQGNKQQGLHTVAYSALLKSTERLFTNIDLTKALTHIRNLHQLLYVTYFLSAMPGLESKDCFEIKGSFFKGKTIHDLKNLGDEVYQELMRTGLFKLWEETTQTRWLQIYLTIFIALNNLLLDATISKENQPSHNRGESAAWKGLVLLEKIAQICDEKTDDTNELDEMLNKYQEKIANEESTIKSAVRKNMGGLTDDAKEKNKREQGNAENRKQLALDMCSLISTVKDTLKRGKSCQHDLTSRIKNIAIAFLSKLIDEEAILLALKKGDVHADISLIGFQIIGIYKLLNSLPHLAEILSFNSLFSQQSPATHQIQSLNQIIFNKFTHEQEVLKWKPSESDPQRQGEIEKSLSWLKISHSPLFDWSGTASVAH